MDPLELLGLDPARESEVILTGEGAFTPGDILERASAVAAVLVSGGAAGRPAIVNMDASVGFAAGLIGSWLAGCVPILLDPLVKDELQRAVDRTGAGAAIRGAMSIGQVPEGVLLVTPDGARGPMGRTAPSIEGSEPILYLFTSGSTGQPALVPKTFEQVDVERRFISRLLGSPRRVATLVPWCHIFGFLFSFLVPLRGGGVCDLSAGISPRAALEKARAGEVDLVVAVPAIYRVMIRILEDEGGGPIASGCRFASSGATLPDDVRGRFEAASGVRIHDFYGSTEAGGVAYRSDGGPWRVEPHVEWRISPEGHLEVSSPSVSVAANAPGGFYRLGDLVEAADGGFTLKGRADDVVKIGGRRISLDEIQGVVESCPGVDRAAVLARPVRGVNRIVSCVVSRKGGVTPAGIKAHVRARLADHKVPRAVVLLERIPTTPAGKVDRPALEDMLVERERN